jgi:23S rRNA (guanine2535-N1)-methyltransferase
MAYLHWHDLEAVLGSDVDEEALALAERNLGLLTLAGLARRRAEVAAWLDRYGKQAHADALASIERFRDRLETLAGAHPMQRRLFRADATNAQALAAGLQGTGVDIVMADVPYGEHTAWLRPDGQALSADEAGWRMLDALRRVVSTATVVAVATRKGRAIEHSGYRRRQRLRLGKRLVDFFSPKQEAVGQEGWCYPRS